MSQRSFIYTAGTVFAVVGVLHLIRSVMGWSLYVENWNLPIGVSVIVFLFLGFLAFSAFRLMK